MNMINKIKSIISEKLFSEKTVPEEKNLFFRNGTDDTGIFRTVVYDNEYRLPDKLKKYQECVVNNGNLS